MPRTSVAVERLSESSVAVAERRQAGAFEQGMTELFMHLAEVLGIPKSVGAIYGLLFASPDPLSFTEILERLDISKGSVSQSLRVLRALGAVQEVSSPADRCERFVPELGLRKLVGGVLKEKVDPLVSGSDARIKQLQEQVRQMSTAADAKFARTRLKQIENWRSQMRLLLPVLKTMMKV